MSYPKRQFWIRPRGVVADLPTFAVPDEYLTGCENVVFRSGIPERIKGQRSTYETVQDDVLALINTRVGTTNYWMYHGTDKSYVASSSGHTDVTLAAGLTAVDAAHQWSVTSLNGVLVANNTKDPPMYWDGNPANAMVALPDWPAGSRAEVLTAHRYHLFALALHESGGEFLSKVMWSAAAEPGTVPSEWTASAANEAGGVELADEDSPLRTAKTLRGSLLVYKANAVYAAEYVRQSQNIYEFRPLFSNFGALTKRAVVDCNGKHFVVADGDIWLTDGSQYRSVGEDKVRRTIFDALDQTNYEMLFAVPNRSRNEVWVCYPTSGNSLCNRAAVYDLGHDEWGFRDLPDVSCGALGIESADAPSQIIDDQTLVIDTVTAKIDAQNFNSAAESLLLGVPGTPELVVVDTTDSTTVAAKVELHDLVLGDAARVKLVKRVHVQARNYGTIHVRIGSRMTPSGPVTWSPEVTLTSPASVVDSFATGRFISIEIRSADTADWTLAAVGLELEPRGYA